MSGVRGAINVLSSKFIVSIPERKWLANGEAETMYIRVQSKQLGISTSTYSV